MPSMWSCSMKPAAQCVAGTSANRVPVGVNVKLPPRFARSMNTAISARVTDASGQERAGFDAHPVVTPCQASAWIAAYATCAVGTSANATRVWFETWTVSAVGVCEITLIDVLLSGSVNVCPTASAASPNVDVAGVMSRRQLLQVYGFG